MKCEWYQAHAEKLLAPTQRSAHPNAAARSVLERFERQADTAEAWQASLEEYLARAVDALQRADHARQAAGRAKAAAARLEGERRREAERLRKNARGREPSRQRRLTEPPRANKRTGMHALAIEIDPAAYRAVRSEALRRGSTILKLIGEILSDRSLDPRPVPSTVTSTRWRRTGGGRRANQHMRIDIDDETWRRLHVDAFEGGRTLARCIGFLLEAWAADL